MNHRIRSNGLSAKEILFKRDIFTNEHINFSDNQIQDYKYAKRTENHRASELSKSRGSTRIDDIVISAGDIVHVKHEGTKHRAREFYLVTSVDHERKEAFIQKFCGSQLRGRRYLVKLAELYPAAANCNFCSSSSNSDKIDIRNDISEPQLRRSNRIRNQPDYIATNEIQRT